MRVDPRQRRLDDVADGETGPAEAFVLVRELLAENAPGFARRVYLALQAVVRRLVAEVPAQTEATEWCDVSGRAAAMMLQAGETSLAERTEALVDLLRFAGRFVEMQPLEEVVRRRHHAEVMRLLHDGGGTMSRNAILKSLDLGQSNLTRVITNLEGHGLVRRQRAGREANLRLTDSGRTRLGRLKGWGPPVPGEAVWQARRVGVTRSSSDGRLLAANEGFEAAVGSSAQTVVARSKSGGPSEDVNVSEGRWVRRIDVGLHEGETTALWVDVSDVKQAEIGASSRVAGLEIENAALRDEIRMLQERGRTVSRPDDRKLLKSRPTATAAGSGASPIRKTSRSDLAALPFTMEVPAMRLLAHGSRTRSAHGNVLPVMVGEGAFEALRRRDHVPAFIYGGGEDPQAIAVDLIRTRTLIYAGGFKTTVFDISVGRKKTRAIPRDFQLDPVTGVPLHVDFLRIVAGQTVTVEVPVHFLNEEAAPGIKQTGGTLAISKHTLELEVVPDQIPEAVEVDLTGREVGDVIRVSDIEIPAGTYTGEADDTVAAIIPSIPSGSGEAIEVEGGPHVRNEAAEDES